MKIIKLKADSIEEYNDSMLWLNQETTQKKLRNLGLKIKIKGNQTMDLIAFKDEDLDSFFSWITAL